MLSQKKPYHPPRPGPTEIRFVLDYVAGTTAVLADERGNRMAVPVSRLVMNPPPAPGDVIRVPLGEAHRPLWHAAEVSERGA